MSTIEAKYTYFIKLNHITIYDTVVNITLDTNGAAGHTAGCGTTPSGSVINYNKVTVAGQSRQYILWYPDNYDSTHAYRLIICYHWFSGSASQVFDCTHRYSGMRYQIV